MNPDIYTVLVQSQIDNFRITDIRDILLSQSMKFKNKSTVRQFVERHIKKLLIERLLICNGEGRKKTYSKTPLFFEADIQPAERRNISIFETKENRKSQISDNTRSGLKEKRARVEAELTILLAEIDEYESLMSEFPDAHHIAKKLYIKATNHSTALTGKITAITKSIQLANEESSK